MSAPRNRRARDMAIVAGLRTPFCKAGGALQGASAADLASAAFRELLDRTDIARDEIERGQVLAKPGSIKPHKKFECEVYILAKEEGGRHTPIMPGYRPQFYFRTTDVTGTLNFAGDVAMAMPGDNVDIAVELITPIAMDEHMRFAVREGGRTVASGRVTKIVE